MQISVLQAILLGIFCFLFQTGMFPLGWLSMNIASKPLIQSAIIGLIMGNVKDAVLIGCVIQAAYIGQMSIGGVSTLPTINVSLWFALPLILISGGDAAECLTICLAFAAFEQLFKTFGNIVKIGFLHKQDELIEKGKIKKAWWFPALSHVYTFVVCMVIVPTLCLAGSSVVSTVINALPKQINGITNTFTGLLPAIGFMLLMTTMIHDKLQWVFFFFGFILAAGLGWSTIAITIMGCVLAYLVFQFTPKKQELANDMEDDD